MTPRWTQAAKAWLHALGPAHLHHWQWLAIAGLLVGSLLVGAIASRVTCRVLRRVARQTRWQWDDGLFLRASGPLTFFWTLILVSVGLPALDLTTRAEAVIAKLLNAAKIVLGLLLMLHLTEMARRAVMRLAWAQQHPSARSLVPFVTQLTKILWFALAGVLLLAVFGYPINHLVAGIGISGLVVAFAARQTGENLFSAFSLGTNANFREGHLVRVEGFFGHVESVGLLGSTLRTLDRTLVTLSNAKLANANLESFTARDRLHLHCKLGLVYGTSVDQVRQVVDSLRGILRNHPKIWPQTINVHFVELAESSLDIDVMAWFQTNHWDEFLNIRQDVLLQFMQAVEEAGTGLAFPTRTLHVRDEREAMPTASRQASGRDANASLP